MYLVVSQDACVRTALWSIFLFGFSLFRACFATPWPHGTIMGWKDSGRNLSSACSTLRRIDPLAKWRRKSKYSCLLERTTGDLGYLHVRKAFKMWEVENTYPSDGKPSIVRA